jgi:hypothetical protein
MNAFRNWYLQNYTQITWFLIGFLVMAGLIDLVQGDYVGSAISFGLAYVNYILGRR